MRELEKMHQALFKQCRKQVEEFARKHKDFDDVAHDIAKLIKAEYTLEEAYKIAKLIKRYGDART